MSDGTIQHNHSIRLQFAVHGWMEANTRTSSQKGLGDHDSHLARTPKPKWPSMLARSFGEMVPCAYYPDKHHKPPAIHTNDLEACARAAVLPISGSVSFCAACHVTTASTTGVNAPARITIPKDRCAAELAVAEARHCAENCQNPVRLMIVSPVTKLRMPWA